MGQVDAVKLVQQRRPLELGREQRIAGLDPIRIPAADLHG
jgi:hypothetical protein